MNCTPKIKTASLNMNGNCDRNRMYQVLTLMVTEGVSILALQDTHMDRDLACRFVDNWPDWSILSSVKEDGTAGVAILINTGKVDWGMDIDQLHDLNDWGEATGRVLVAPIRVGEVEVVVGCVYAPALKPERRSWTAIVKNAMGASAWNERPGCDIICGDWNMIVKRLDSKLGLIATDNEREIEAHNELLEALSPEETDMVDGWRLRYPESRVFTHRNSAAGRSAGGETRIDRIYVRDDWYQSCPRWEILPVPISDHDITTMVYQRPGQRNGPGRWKLPLSLIATEEVLNGSLEILKDEMGRHNAEEPLTEEDLKWQHVHILQSWLAVKQRIKDHVSEFQKTRNRLKSSRMHTLRLKAQGVDKRGRTLTAEQISTARHELEAFLEDNRREYCTNSYNQRYVLEEQPTEQLHKRVKAKRASSGIARLQPIGAEETVERPEELLDVVETYYKDLYNERPSDEEAREILFNGWNKTLSEQDQGRLITPFSGREIQAGFSKAKMGRSPGLDGIPVDLWKWLYENDEEAAAMFTRVLHAMQEIERFDVSMKRGCLTLLYKKGDPADIRNYRPLSIMNADYKFFTALLSRRLTIAIAPLIGLNQSAFLPGRIMGDNIKLVQTVIDKFRNSDSGIGILFLDQEKGYDRISHRFLFGVLKKFRVPNKIVDKIRALYFGGVLIPFVNGFPGNPVPQLCGVRQGDPLSCLLYVMVIETLSVKLNSDDLLRGIRMPNEGKHNHNLFADDIVLLLNSRAETNRAFWWLAIYGRASDARVATPKSRGMVVGNLPPDVFPEEIELVKEGETHKHLGVPVGVNCGDAIFDYWDGIVNGTRDEADRIVKLRLSQNARLTIATTVILAKARFAMEFLDIGAKHVRELEVIQKKLIWGKDSSVKRSLNTLPVKDMQAPRARGGLECQNIGGIRDALAIGWVARMEKKPDLPWVELAKPLLQETSETVSLRRAKALTPWRQNLNSKKGKPAPYNLSHIWKRWWEIIPYGEPFNESLPLRFVMPKDAGEALRVNFWYFPHLFRGGGARALGVKMWSNDIWERIAADEFGAFNRIGDFIDPGGRGVKEFLDINPPRTRNQVFRAFDKLMGSIPRQWVGWIQQADNAEFQRATAPGSPEFNHCVMVRKVGEREHVKPLRELDYKWAYKTLAMDRSKDISLNDRVAPVAETMTILTGKTIREAHLWKAVKTLDRVPKCNDLLYRLMLKTVKTGSALSWLEPEKWYCPIDGEDETIEHVFIECDVADTVWKAFIEIHGKASLGKETANKPLNRNELIGLMAIGPGITEKRSLSRYRVLYSEVIWQLWKLYQDKQRRDEGISTVKAVGIYRTAVLHRMMMDRALIYHPKNALKKESLMRDYHGMWGEWPSEAHDPLGPRCLRLNITPEELAAEAEGDGFIDTPASSP